MINFQWNFGVGKEAILAEIEKKTLKGKNSKEQLGGISQSFQTSSSNANRTTRQSEDLIIYLLSKKDSDIYKKIKENIEVSDISDEVRKNLVSKLYDMYESGEINTQSIDSSGIVIFEDKVSSLRRFKDDVREVATGYECGIGLERFNDIKVGDILESYIMETIEQ